MVGAFFDFFFAWLFDDFLDFLVVLVAAVPVSGAIAVVPWFFWLSWRVANRHYHRTKLQTRIVLTFYHHDGA